MAGGLDRNARASGDIAALSQPASEAETTAPADPSRSSAADNPATPSPGVRTSVAQASKSSCSVIQRIMHNGRHGAGRRPGGNVQFCPLLAADLHFPLQCSWQKPRFLPAERKLMSDKRAGSAFGRPEVDPQGAIQGGNGTKSAAGDFFQWTKDSGPGLARE